MDTYSRFKKLFFACFTIIIISIVGVLGYVYIEGYTISEAFYMTTITISTVGFQEVHPLSANGRIFTVILILTSLGTFAYAISVISIYIIEGEFRRHWVELKKVKKIKQLQNHTIICGYGRNGKQILRELEEANEDSILIEKNSKVINAAKKDHCKNYIEGEATEDAVLLNAGIKRAKAIITTLPKDADNVFVVLTAREMNSELKIISRASKDSSYQKLIRSGANHVIMPDKVGGSHMASLIIKPDVVEFLNHLSGQDENVSLEEISYENLPLIYKDKSLKELNIQESTGVNIVGLKNREGKFLVHPSSNMILSEGTKIFVLGVKNQIEKLLKGV